MVERTCLVTGGAGFVLAAQFLSARLSGLTAWSRLMPCIRKSIRPGAAHRFGGGIELVVGDVTDPGTWGNLLAQIRPSAIVHLAAETGTGAIVNGSHSTRSCQCDRYGDDAGRVGARRAYARPDFS